MDHDFEIGMHSSVCLLQTSGNEYARQLKQDLLRAKKGGAAVTKVVDDLKAIADLQHRDTIDAKQVWELPFLVIPVTAAAKAWVESAAIRGSLRALMAGGSQAGGDAAAMEAAAGVEIAELDEMAGAAGVAVGELGEEGALVLEATASELEVGSSGGPIGLLVALAVIAVSVPIIAFAAKDEYQVHFVVNFSSSAFTIRPGQDVLNVHGKTVVIPAPENDDNGSAVVILPRSDVKTGDPSMATLAFSKDDNALAGATGGYQFHPLGGDAKKAAPFGFKIYYHQPNAAFTENGIGCYCDAGYNLEKIVAKFDDESSLLTHTYTQHGVRVSAALDSKTGQHNYAVIIIEDI